MKKQLSLTLTLLSCLFLALPLSAQQRKKVGIVLSGGGAKGVAHIGALKVIREAGIPIDYIAGTSMGSIIGGLSAIGYNPAQLDSMVRDQNWSFLLSDRIKRSEQTMTERKNAETYVLSVPFTKNLKERALGGVIQGQNLDNLFQSLTFGYHDSINFNKLPIPFACVSENIVNGDKIVFHKGELATAMRASMAIPGVFTPVRIDSMVLVDGGMVDNFPVDVVKAMGAEIVIGVDVQSNLRGAGELNTASDILMQIINLSGQNIYLKNITETNAYIKVDVEGYSSASFSSSAIDTLINRGEVAARNNWDELIKLKKQIGIPEDYKATYPEADLSLMETKSFFVKNIKFSGIQDDDKKWLMRKCSLQENSKITMEQLKKALSILRGSRAYSNVGYKLMNAPEGYNLDFLLEERYEKNINLGIRFDSEEIASMLLNATLYLKTHIPSNISVTGRLGKRYLARVDYTLEPMQMRNFNFGYIFEYNDINIYNQGERAYNTTYKYHSGEFSFSDVWYKNLRFAIGVRFEHFKYKDFLYNSPEVSIEVKPEHFFSYFANIHYNTFDKAYFPTKGADLQVGYSLYTDNLTQYKDNAPFSALNASWTEAFEITNRFALIPSLYGRVLIGREIPYPYLNALGGNYFGRFLPQQMPFAGIIHTELSENSVVVGALQLRQRMGGKNYISLTGNVALANQKFFDLFQNKCIYGFSLGYGYDSIFGPLEASLGYSNKSKEVGFYINLGFYF